MHLWFIFERFLVFDANYTKQSAGNDRRMMSWLNQGVAMRTLAMVMAGGLGSRLHPLTRDRAKPAVPFGGKYRIIDFVLSNLVNSRIYAIYVLVQWRSQSLIEHLKDGWQFGEY